MSTMTSNNRASLVEKSGVLHVYYANKTFKHWKKRWLLLQDQILSIYQDSRYKRVENTINVKNFRVSITSPHDPISNKSYTFKLSDPKKISTEDKPLFLAADNQPSMTQWINALRLSASIVNDVLIEPHFVTDLNPVDTDSESDYSRDNNDWLHNRSSRVQYRSYKPTMPVAATSSDQNRYLGSNEDEEDEDDDHRWYRPRSSSPPFPLGGSSIHQSTTTGSWGFDVNRSANGQPPPFTSNNSNNNNSDHRTITRTPRRMDESVTTTGGGGGVDSSYYNERLVDVSSPPPARFKLRTPTLNRRRDIDDFAVVDRLVLGPNRTADYQQLPIDDSPRQQQYMSSSRSRQSSTRSILRGRSKSIGDFTASTTSSPHPHPQSRTSPNSYKRTQTENELMAWQSRMLQRDQRMDSGTLRPTSAGQTHSPRMSSRRDGFNTSQSSSRPMPSTRPISVMSNMSGSQRFDHDYHESMIKSARVIKRYIELLYHLQTFYERVTDQLYGGNSLMRNHSLSSHSVFMTHCRKIADQLQNAKPVWERKLVALQRLLKDVSSLQNPREWSLQKSETTFMQRRSTLTNLMQNWNARKDLDETQLSILNDIDRVLHEDKLALQLQDELSTLLQHQSLLNDFYALLQWNRQIYSSNEQNRVESVLPFLGEQITTTDGYVSHVSQQLTELVANLRSLEKYILSYINTIPLIDDGMVPSQRMSPNRGGWRPYNETDLDTMRTKNISDRTKATEEHHRTSRYQSRPISTHQRYHYEEPQQQYPRSGSPTYRTYTNENQEWLHRPHRRSPSPSKTRSVSTTRYVESLSPLDPMRTTTMTSTDGFDRDPIRISARTDRWSPRKSNLHLNTNNSNNNGTSRIATVKPARRENGNGTVPTGILKPYSQTRSTTTHAKLDFDVDTIDKEIFKPDKVDIPDRLVDFGNDDQMLTANERLAKSKKKEEVRKMLSKQSVHEMNDHDLSDGGIHLHYNQRRFEKDVRSREKALDLQSAIAEEAKEKSRQVAAKHYLNKSYQQRSARLNS